jgi:hypothetical protein
MRRTCCICESLQACSRLRNQENRISISWIKGHNGNTGNERADALAGRAANNTQHSTGTSSSHQVSIAWMNQKVSQLYSEAATLELREGKHTIIPPPPKKSAMDKARNRDARISCQLRTNHGSLEYISSELANEPMPDACSMKIDMITYIHLQRQEHMFYFAVLPLRLSGAKFGKIQLLVPSPGLDRLAPCYAIHDGRSVYSNSLKRRL